MACTYLHALTLAALFSLPGAVQRDPIQNDENVWLPENDPPLQRESRNLPADARELRKLKPMLVRSSPAAEAPENRRVAMLSIVAPEDATPVDMMLEHQLRMSSADPRSIARVVLLDARHPSVDKRGMQDVLLAQYRRTFRTLSKVEVRPVQMELEAQNKLLQKYFTITDQADGDSTIFNEVTNPETKRKAAYFVAGLNMLDACLEADDKGVGLCFYLEKNTFIYRDNEQGLVELANSLFNRDKAVVVAQPPDMCEYTRVTKGKVPKWAASAEQYAQRCTGNSTKVKLSDRSLILHRKRLAQLLPFNITTNMLNRGFDTALALGLRQLGHEKAKKMQCGHAFVIKAASTAFPCRGEAYNVARQARVVAGRKESLKLAATKSGKSPIRVANGEYKGFDHSVVSGLPEIIDRIESGKLPATAEGVINQCSEMCPSKKRMQQEGLAW